MATIQSLKAFLTAQVSTCEFSQLNALINDENIRCKITFLGKRVITVQGEEGSVSLSALAEKVVSIIRARCPSKWPSNDTPDKVAAKSVVDRLYKYYCDTDTLISHTNFFTWILAEIRDLASATVRAHWDIEYLHDWNFKVGYEIPHCSLLWGHPPVPQWVKRSE